VKPDRSEVLERFESMFAPPAPSFEAFLRERERRRRNQRLTAIVVVILVFAVPVWIVAADTWSRDTPDTPTPAVPGPPPRGAAIDQAFVDGINGCRWLLVSPEQAESVLGFRATPVPFELGGTPGRIGVEEPLSTGCQYASLDRVPGLGEVLLGHEGPGGNVVITAYLADAPPPPLGRSDPVLGLGDAASFSPYGNGDEHLLAYEGATSVLEVRRGDLILRFNGGSWEVAGNAVVQHLIGYAPEPLAALAERALATLDAMPGVTGPTEVTGPTGPDVRPDPLPGHRQSRTVDGVTFSFAAHRTWTDGPIVELPDGELRSGRLLISKSIAGPQGAEAVIFWTGIADGGPARPCGQWWGSPVGSLNDYAVALGTTPGVELVEGPAQVTVGGLPARHVVVTVRDDVGCDPGFFYRWRAECWGPCWIRSNVGDTIRVWLVDVDGTRLFFAAETSTQADDRLVEEIQRIIGSIRFG
jgi:hypothetical protein